MKFLDAIKKNYFDEANKFVTEGRATRSEFWWCVLFYLAVAILISIFLNDVVFVGVPLAIIFGACVLPVSSRRLQDTGINGNWLLVYFGPYLVGLIGFAFAGVGLETEEGPILSWLWLVWAGYSVIGFFVWIVFMSRKGDAGDNKYGPPLGRVNSEEGGES